MSSLQPTTHNLYWHKERMLLLEAIVLHLKINLGKLMERDRFDEKEEEYPLASEIDLKYSVVEEERGEKVSEKEKKKEVEKEKAGDGKGEGVPYDSIAEVLLFLQLHMKKEEAVWQFHKEVHEWYANEFAEAVVPPPQFPNWVLSRAGPSEPATASSELKKKKANATPLKKPGETDAQEPETAAKSTAAAKGKEAMVEEAEEEKENQRSSDSAKEAEEGENEEGMNEAEEEERERKSKAEAESRKFNAAGPSVVRTPASEPQQVPAPVPYNLADKC